MTLGFFILNLVQSLALIYIEGKLLNSKIDLKNKKFYIVLLVLTLYLFFAYLITKSVIRIILFYQVYVICNLYLFSSEENDISKTTITTLYSLLILLLSEVIIALICGIFLSSFINLEETNAYTNNIISYAIILAYVLIASIKKVQDFSAKIISLQKRYTSYNIIIFGSHVFIILTSSLYLIYFDLSQILKLILLIVTFADYIYLVYSIIIAQQNKLNIQKELDLMIEVATKYEDTINDVRTKNHENKNQLIVIKDLVKNNKKEAISYIDSMINTKYNEDDELLVKVANIPTGGLKGLLYYKLLTMKSNKIDYHLEISKNINKNCLTKLDIKLLQSYYKIIGVFIDNAIEAVAELKEKIILIELFEEDDFLVFAISNEYKNPINFSNLGSKRFTTKGKEHGYGLQLVKQLVFSNKDLFNKTEVIGNLFVQKVGIKIKKLH